MSDSHNQEHNHENCGCGHNHSHDENNTMKLVLENGEELECSVIDIFSTDEDETEYIALLPFGEEEVLIYRFNEFEDGSFELVNIESDEEFEKVESAFFDMFDEDLMFDEDFDNDDEECENEEKE